MNRRLPLLGTSLLVFLIVALVTVFFLKDRNSTKSFKEISDFQPVGSKNEVENLITEEPGPAMVTERSYAYEEPISPSHIRRVEIIRLFSMVQALRRERVYHVDIDGHLTLKQESSYVADEILVGINGNSVPAELDMLGTYKHLYPESGLGHFLLKLTEAYTESVPEALDLLRDVTFAETIRFAEPNWVVQTSVLPNDPLVQDGTQWAMRNQASGSDIRAGDGWDIRTEASDVVVAILDSGILETHEDLADNLWTNPNETPGNGTDDDSNGIVDDIFGYNSITENGLITDDNGHGTHVAGTIGAVGNNGLGVSGVSWRVQLMAVKSMNAEGAGLTADVSEGIMYAVDHGADIINASLGAPFFQNSIKEAIEYAEANNVLFVAAAGNEGSNNDGSARYPASYDVPNIVAIASLDQSGALSSFSNFGKSSVDMSAPGGDILSTYHNGNASYGSLSGTSMAAPHVSGVLALLIQEFPGEDYSRYIDRLYQGGFTLAAVEGVVSYSSGLDLERSLGIANPPSGLRFTSQMPHPLIRFQFQNLELSTVVEDDTDVAYNWTKDGQTLGSSESTLLVENLKLSDSGTFTLAVEKDGQQIRDVSSLNVIAANIGLSSAIDSSLSVGTEGFHPWTATAEASSLGSTSVFSASIGNNSSSSLYSYVEGEGSVSFDWKVSSELGYDFLQLLINGQVIRSISGDTAWRNQNIQLSGPELKMLEWRYVKDGTVRKGLDRGYLDNLDWHPDNAGLPYISSQPEGLILSVGDNASLVVEARGEALQYQWFKDGLEIPGANQAELNLNSVSEDDSGVYHVEVFNSTGSVQSQPVPVDVGEFPVEILLHPSNLTVLEGYPAHFLVEAFGSPPLQYQWFKDEVLIPGAKENEFVIDNPVAEDSGDYHVLVSNAFSQEGVESERALLNVQQVQVGPSIVKQSYNLSIPEGQPAELFVTVAGTGPFGYQWYFNNEAIPGATEATYQVDSLFAESTGAYFCVVSNAVGETRSALMFISLRGNLGDAVEQPLLSWESNRATNVRRDVLTTHDGVDSLALFAEPEASLTWVRTWIEGPAEVSFHYFMDGTFTPLSGRFFFLVDGIVVEELQNPEAYVKKSYVIEESGRREIRWSHVSNSLPLHAFVDEVVVTPVTLIKNTQSTDSKKVGEDYSVELDFRSSKPHSIEWYKDGNLIGGENSPKFFIQNLKLSDSATYQAKLTNQYGSFWSPNFRLFVSEVPIPNASVVYSGIKFEADSPVPWVSQSGVIFKGPKALMSPSSGSLQISTSVQGPISGVFYSKGLRFNVSGPRVWTEKPVGNGWTRTVFDLSADTNYEIGWQKAGPDPGYLEGLEFLPYFSLKSYRTEIFSIFQNSILRVQMGSTDGVSFQWYQDGEPIPGANMEYHIVYYEDVEDVSTFHVEVSVDGITRKGEDMTVSRGDALPDQNILFVDGLYLQANAGTWKVTDLETTATDGLSLHPGTLGSGDTQVRALFFGVRGPGEISFRLKIGSDAGSLKFRNAADQTRTYTSAADWTEVTTVADGPFRYELEFSHQPTGSESYTEIPIFIDDLRFTPTELPMENIEDEYVTLGAPFRKRLEIPWEEGYTVEWFKNGAPLKQFDQEIELIIPKVADSDEAQYTIQLIGPLGEVLLKEFSLFPQTNLYSGPLDSEVAYWRVADSADWVDSEVADATGGQALTSSFDRFTFDGSFDPGEEPTIRIQPLFSGPGSFTTRFKFSNDAGTTRLSIYRDGELFGEYDASPSGWEEHTIEIEGPVAPEILLLVQADADFSTHPSSLILDSLRFEPGERAVALRSMILGTGDEVTIPVEYTIPGTELFTYSLEKDGVEVQSNSDGQFELDSLRTDDFGSYNIKITDEKGILSEHPVQLIQSTSLGERFTSIGFPMMGEGDALLEVETTDHSGRSQVARVNPGTGR